MKTNNIDFERLLEFAPGAILIIDSSFKIVFSNHNLNNLLDFKKEQIQNSDVEIVFQTESVVLIQKIISESSQTQNIETIDETANLIFNKTDGSSFTTDVIYKIIAYEDVRFLFIIVTQSKTISNQNQKLFNASDERYHALVDLAPDAIFVVNRDGNIEYANNQAYEIFNYNINELIGQQIEILIPKGINNHHQMRQQYFNTPRVRTMGSGLELSGVRKEGVLIPVAISLSPFDFNGELMVITTVRDITVRKQSENEIKKLNEQLLCLDQAKSLFLQIISHELRTPLHGIISFTNMITEKIDSPELLTYMGYLKMLNERLEDFTNIALNMTKLRLNEYEFITEDFSIYTLIKAVILKNADSIEEKNIVINITAEETITLLADKELMHVCINNILNNAIKFSPVGGTIKIKVRESKSEIEIEITDQGNGFSDESLERQFRLFATEDQHFDGNIGLGLALCKMITDSISGKIVLSNRPNTGACVQIILPKRHVIAKPF